MRVSLVSALTLMVLGLFCSGCQIARRSAVINSASATSIQVTSTDSVSAEIPGDHVIVKTSVNSHELRLILDTGVTHVLVSPEIAAATGLKQARKIPITGLGGTERGSAGLGVAETLNVESALGKKVEVLITPFPALFEADGLLGLSFLSHANFRLDYQAKQVSFAAPTNSTLSELGSSVPMRIEGQLLTMPAEVDGTPVRLMLDTGASQTLTLKSWFVEEQKLRQRYSQRLKVVTGRGLFGVTRGEVARLQTLKIGDYSITNVCVEFGTKRKARRSSIDGMIGAGVLSQFTLTF
jgi:predicted aspartyl protease